MGFLGCWVASTLGADLLLAVSVEKERLAHVPQLFPRTAGVQDGQRQLVPLELKSVGCPQPCRLFTLGSRTKTCWAVCAPRKSGSVGVSNPTMPRDSLPASKRLVSGEKVPAEIILKEPSPSASHPGPQVSCFQNDLRHVQLRLPRVA